ncbi:hypothetical protein K7711_46660 [Nocardia sp. CA2R105]|uniref:hypothetical protein n=1 Tax=Nocardia coffeae TaxID=2873381 RepID=UPI001CA75F02|nr:hypothetical protein [Nocardia coffeae]MBY8864015.1 hypothetical protein [Nocardia coffeae]
MRPRPDLVQRRARVDAERWIGGIEGIDLTMTFLRQKRAETQRLARLAPAGPVGGKAEIRWHRRNLTPLRAFLPTGHVN